MKRLPRSHVELFAAGAAFVAIAGFVTWPLPLRLRTSVPGDLGDPLFVSWVIGWVARRLSSAIVDPASLRSFWDAGIFYPETTTLALSEHFIPQTVLVLPVYWLTHNLILCYNLVFLTSLVLTATGTTLLVRALTGNLVAGMLGGVVATFNEYFLIAEVSHLQTLSIGALPLALLGVHRYLATGSRAKLCGGAAAWLVLNLSSVYYLAYCSPFIIAFGLAEAWRLGRWREKRVWFDLAAATAGTLALTLPFLLPYAAVQKRFDVFRAPAEVAAYSATVDHYRAALPKLAVPILMSAVSIAIAFVQFVRQSKHEPPAMSPSLIVIVLVMLSCAVWLSFGPVVRVDGRPVAVPALYDLLARLPGYAGLRTPSRFAALFLVFLGVMAGLGAGALVRTWRRAGIPIVVACIAIFLWQGRNIRVHLDQPLPSRWLAPAPAYLSPSAKLPPIYRAVQRLPPSAVLVELPFGDPWYELRYMAFASMHGRPLVNGYSGVYPPSYLWRQGALANPLRDPARAWTALHGATHVIVHKAAWPDARGEQIEHWLVERGAREIGEAEQAVLYALSPQD